MKHCPECNFTFPDFHRVCDFDGTELVLDPERQSLMKVNSRHSYLRLGLKKPMLLTSLAVLGLFLSAVFIGYFESPAPSIPAIVKDQESRHSSRNLTPIAKRSEQLAEDKLATAPSRTVSSRIVRRSRNRSVISSTARLRRKSAADSSRNEVIARTQATPLRHSRAARLAWTQDSKRTSNDKSPKIVAILKTTWRVLKKPFDF